LRDFTVSQKKIYTEEAPLTARQQSESKPMNYVTQGMHLTAIGHLNCYPMSRIVQKIYAVQNKILLFLNIQQ